MEQDNIMTEEQEDAHIAKAMQMIESKVNRLKLEHSTKQCLSLLGAFITEDKNFTLNDIEIRSEVFEDE